MTNLRRHLVHILVGFAATLLAWLAGDIFDGDSGGLDYYSDDRIGDVNNLLISLLVPIFAGLLAWEIGRLRRSDVLDGDAVIDRWRILLHAAQPTIVMAFLVFAIQHVQRVGVPTISLRNIAGLLLPYIIILSVFMFWAAVAIRVPSALAIPLSVIVTWLAIAYPPSLGWVWARHMTGTFASCCSVFEALAMRAIGATLLFALSTALLAAALMSKRPIAMGVTSCIPVAGLLFVGAQIVEPLGWESVEPRSESELTCNVDDDTEICLWPEHQELRPAVLADVHSIRDKLQNAGLMVPATVTEQADSAVWIYDKRVDRSRIPDRDPAHSWNVRLHRNMLTSPHELRSEILNAVVPRPICDARQISSHDERRSSEKLAPMARAVVWHLMGEVSSRSLRMDEQQHRTVIGAISDPEFEAAAFVTSSIDAILHCNAVDINDLRSIAG